MNSTVPSSETETLVFQGLRRSMLHVVTNFVAQHYEHVAFSNNAQYPDPRAPYNTSLSWVRRKNENQILHRGERTGLSWPQNAPPPLYGPHIILLEDQTKNPGIPTIIRNPYSWMASRIQHNLRAKNYTKELTTPNPDLYLPLLSSYRRDTHIIAERLHAEDIYQQEWRTRLRLPLPPKQKLRPSGYASSFHNRRQAPTRGQHPKARAVLCEHAPNWLADDRIREFSLEHWGWALDAEGIPITH